ncbi:MAG TPA: DUF433 domain-containing protein [Anaerolineales bacterium]|nr:DUF433 domain-containing protein [Anaerolineales bacterium]
MATIAPINLIEIIDGRFRKKARIVGSAITVEEIVNMHLRNGISIDALAEDYDLNHAQIHAALAYYYTHKEDIDAGIQQSEQLLEENAVPLTSLIEKAKGRG